jgi:hypothetical protein
MKDLIGAKFTYWTVVKYSHKKGPHHFWKCQCKCGNVRIIQQGSLGVRSFSCGCLRKKIAKQVNTTHGMSKTLLHGVWERMRQRCENPNAANYSRYGGRGISVCERWHKFEKFNEDMGSGWRRGLTIERVNNDGNYDPSNCRWATKKEQAANRNNSNMVDTPWGRMCLAEAARRSGVKYRTLGKRLERGVPLDKLFDQPSKQAARTKLQT